MSRLLSLVSMLIVTRATGEIMTFDKAGISLTPPQPTESNGEESHLPLSSLFSQSNKYKCMVEGKKEMCTKDDVTYLKKKFGDLPTQKQEKTKVLNIENNENNINKGTPLYGPRFQPVHLALPRREMHQVGHEEIVAVNNRQMTIKTLSQIPYIFEVSNFLSENETELMIDMATQKGLTEKTRQDKNVVLADAIDQKTFDLWDSNFDGKISVEEIDDLKELDPLLLSKDDIKNIMATIDEDLDGFLSYGELTNGGLQKMKGALELREEERSERKRRGASEAWLWHDDDGLMAYEGLLEDFHQRISSITEIPEDLIERSEPISVQKFNHSSFSGCKQDSEPTNNKPCCTYGTTECRMCRYMSIHMFLTDEEEGGDLLFPAADNETFHWQNLKGDLLRKCEKTPNKTACSLAVKPTRGKAVMWYNHELSPYTGWMGQLEARSISSIAPVQDENAWSAKMWLNIIGDGVQELKPWRMASNWLKAPNKNVGLIEKLRNDFYREGESYLHVFRKSYKQMKPLPQSSYLENDFLQPPAGLNYKEDEKSKDTSTESEEINSQASSDKDSNDTESESESESAVELIPEGEGILSIKSDDALKEIVTEPIGPEHTEGEQVPILGFHHKKRQEVPLGPPKRPMDPQPFIGKKIIENGVLKASLLLIEELERDELEIIARSLHEKLQLACIPLIINPIR